MTHPRTLIRKHLAKTLVQAGAWGDAVFVNRVAPISDDEVFPNICIYTQNERTLNPTHQHELRQELSLLVEVREKRRTDLPQSWAYGGAAYEAPAAMRGADDLLDSACDAIESVVMSEFSQTRLTIDGEILDLEEVSEINTEISQSADGIVPFTLAQIEFKVVYKRCFERLDLTLCPLEYFLGEIRHTGCSNEPGSIVPVQLRSLQPALGAPP